jgi:exosortase E/protease (VPEID-CTERM system)
MQHLPLVGQLAISMIAALLIYGGKQLRHTISRTARRIESTRFPWLQLVSHLVALACFYQLTAKLFEGDITSRTNPLPWLAAWAGTGVVSMLCWVASAIPISLWRRVGVSVVGMLLAGTAVALAAVVAGQMGDQLWRPLSGSTFWVVEWLLGAMYDDVAANPDTLVIGTDKFSIRIAPACSGYEGIGLITVFLGSFLWWFRKQLRFPQSLFLLLLGVIAIWIANAVRIAALIAVGTSISPSVAAGGFHSQAGWLAFNVVALAVIGIAWSSPYFAKNTQRKSAKTRAEYPAAPFVVPLLVLLLTATVTGAFSGGGFDPFYGLRVLTTLLVILFFLNVYRRQAILEWSWSWRAVAIGVAVFCLWLALEPLAGVDASARGAQAAALGSLPPVLAAVWLVFRAIGSVFVVPFVEELAFRGYLMRLLIDEHFERVPMGSFTYFSLAVSSLVFGLMHGRWLAGTLAGLLFALAVYHRGQLSDAVVAHATANGLITAYVLGTGNWQTWS